MRDIYSHVATKKLVMSLCAGRLILSLLTGRICDHGSWSRAVRIKCPWLQQWLNDPCSLVTVVTIAVGLTCFVFETLNFDLYISDLYELDL